MRYDPSIHHRRSIRLKGYDYTQPGAYFVTLVAARRENIFGEVVNGVMKLSALGQIVHDEWLRSNGIRMEIRLHEDEFVVMPNHVHGIVWLVEIPVVGGARRAPQQEEMGEDSGPCLLQRIPKSLGGFIAGFKSTVTRRARQELNLMGIWQRNYYEHIIRSETGFKNIWKYMEDNPRCWEADLLFPSVTPDRFNQE